MTLRSSLPRATYRLQFHKDFTFDDAVEIVPYLADLGISHVYASPILTARAGSMHGYDGVDPTAINPELGGEAGFRRLCAALAGRGLGVIVDIVPNHVAVGGADNRWWLDVLEKGRDSAFADWFDIDFDGPEPELQGKVLAPFLGSTYAEALADGSLTLVWDEALQKLAFAYGPHRFPLRPEDYAEVGGSDPAAADLSAWNEPDRLHALLERQNFRLALWSVAGDIINWRRFFDISELAGLRMENPATFEAVHAVIFGLYAEGLIDGVRIDHVDGLSDPAAYCRTLRSRLDELAADRPAKAAVGPAYIVVEKILAVGEALPDDWGVQGASGYDFMNQVSALQHDPDGAAPLTALWTEISGRAAAFETEETAARVEILTGAFEGQLTAAARALRRLAAARTDTRDLTTAAFRRALIRWITHLRVYRSYATGRADGPPPGEAVDRALDLARADARAETAAIDFIAGPLHGPRDASEATADTVRRLNQLTAPVTAKAVEDTAFYRYGRLLSRNDVGFDPTRLSMTPEEFLQSGVDRAADWPHAMLATATHDHKRGEDVRARLAVLSEIPDAWATAVRSWFATNAGVRPPGLAPDDEYQLYQTLVGAWPTGLAADDAAGLGAFAGRIEAWREKSLREAKLRSSWACPDGDYEAASRDFIRALLDPRRSPAFLSDLTAFTSRIAPAGAINGVVQAALRCLWPGVPDLYQGAELEDLSLVDPDNRRPVDYGRVARLLADEATGAPGAMKLRTIARLLAARAADPELFARGSLEPVTVEGARAGRLLAFRRSFAGRGFVAAVPLRIADALEGGSSPGRAWWGDTRYSVDGRSVLAADSLAGDSIAFHRFPVEDSNEGVG
ncbi:MAG: malto-oligosyltrehalose synthase [Pseudomonadota bacterium]|nr:malto-oligosyltrehalose synthase [Pseudomonadota bacterium]